MASNSTTPNARKLRIAVDIGGTFTDMAAFDEATGQLLFGKALSTHGALVNGIQSTLDSADIDLKDGNLFLHGSTIAINTLLERNGANTALLITEGFRDIYEIGRVNRPDAYNLFFNKHQPLVRRSLRFEVAERLRADGSLHKPLDEAAVRELAKELKGQGIEAVAVLLLHSYRNPAHEQRVKAILQEELPQAFVSASHELSQEYREFERVSTVVANAYVGPRVSQYLGQLETHLSAKGFGGDFYVVQSTGGLFPIEHARVGCVRMLESGPAAGVIGAQAICAQLGMGDAIAFDMGGTTAKAGVISEGRPLTTGSALIGGYERALPIQIPMMDIHEVGTGGGSIARVETGNALRVGPQSAGSIPGPVAYGRGGQEPTVTDANLVLGRLDADNFLGGELKLDLVGCQRQMAERVATPLGLDPTEAADGILRIAVTQMSHAVKAVTTERGLDAGSFTMVVYGGAGPLHASAIAREIGIRKVLIPYAPGYFSAYGMLFSDLRYDYVRSVFRKLNDVSFDEIEEAYRKMEDEGRAALEQSGVKADGVVIERAADMRYVGQEHAVTVDLPLAFFESRDRSAIKRQFDELHKVRYGTSAPKEPADLVSLRVTVLGTMKKPPKHQVAQGSDKPEADALRAVKPVYFRAGGWAETPVFKRDLLRAGNSISGPALIEEHASTTVVQPGDALRVDELGNLQIAIGSDRT
ncbi:5-oxoprolinase (ATP-hydrolyzing) [Paracidovorax avenae ATCC 19860]|uniref:5-oxoprolinase (ATP-hydrolyzing) n=1 Tax=Paracidovorax avenae (strain ATCC 19860 / DSM 7227 / CCUG 15838 / JCM 20985 / LMG 2117 / NCPPB 1011) TaxID=643561 RepID=F0QDK2_PARA1|nr:hydantoinase/oxoprolinase family protein [Paracidovorax avenae]ADX47562.1 5-oxoprolinase (ATP-hydrolyzing) [Paracidovorax avenae ATCC 19860]